MIKRAGQWVKFRFYRPLASRVELVGDFTDWKLGALPMRRELSGYWTVTVRLDEGDYRFRYRADDQWFCDYAAFGVEYGPFGPDSVVRISNHTPAKAG